MQQLKNVANKMFHNAPICPNTVYGLEWKGWCDFLALDGKKKWYFSTKAKKWAYECGTINGVLYTFNFDLNSCDTSGFGLRNKLMLSRLGESINKEWSNRNNQPWDNITIDNIHRLASEIEKSLYHMTIKEFVEIHYNDEVQRSKNTGEGSLCSFVAKCAKIVKIEEAVERWGSKRINAFSEEELTEIFLHSSDLSFQGMPWRMEAKIELTLFHILYEAEYQNIWSYDKYPAGKDMPETIRDIVHECYKHATYYASNQQQTRNTKVSR